MPSASVIVPTRIDIRDFIVAHFNRGDLMLLCADYFVDFYSRHEGVTTPLDALAQALLEHCEHRGLIDSLSVALETKRAKPWRERFTSVITTHHIARNLNQVFISYATPDEDFARKLAADLRTWNVPVWVAFDCIRRGELWADAIDHALQASGICIVVLSPNSVASRWVKKELRVAERFEHTGEMKIIPLDFQASNWNLLSSFLADFQAISFRESYEAGLRDLRVAIGAKPPLIEKLKIELAEANQHIAQLRAELQVARQQLSQTEMSSVEIAKLKATIASLIAEAQIKDTTLQTAQAQIAQLDAALKAKLTEVATLTDEKRALQRKRDAALAKPSAKPANKDRHLLTLAEGVEIEFVRIPAGEFLYGDDKRKLNLPEYWLGKTVVTTAQYLAFVKATGYKGDDYWNGKLADKLNHPAVCVSWNDAQAFCAWVSKLSGQKVGLPNEQQWEKGARGTDGREYPWGNDAPNAKRANYDKEWNIKNLAPVGNYSPAGDSPYGLQDMAGNVWEWCEDWYDDEKKYRVLRGGAFLNLGRDARCACRSRDVTDYRNLDYGFRVMLSPPL